MVSTPAIARPIDLPGFSPKDVDAETRARLAGTTMILGVGAQKAGTSWLFDYLARSGEIYAPPVKELHFFNAWFEPKRCGGYDERFLLLLAEAERGTGRLLKRRRLAALRARVAMIEDRAAYLRFFAENIGENRLATEVSPCYSLLFGDGFARLRAYFDAVEMEVKPVFLMRDPIERHYSALRMRERDSGGAVNAREIFAKNMKGWGDFARSRYDRTLRSLWRAFREDETWVGFYEHLFSDPETHLRRIADFGGFAYFPPDTDRRINASPRSAPLDLAQREAGVNRFLKVYDFVNTRFETEKPETWHA